MMLIDIDKEFKCESDLTTVLSSTKTIVDDEMNWFKGSYLLRHFDNNCWRLDLRRVEYSLAGTLTIR